MQFRTIRLLRGLSQAELARRAGVGVPLVSYVERGAVPTDPSIVARLAAALDVSVDALSGELLLTPDGQLKPRADAPAIQKEPIEAKPTHTQTRWLTVKEAAARARVSTKAIYQAHQKGALRAAVINQRGDLRIAVEWLDGWLETLSAWKGGPARG